MRANADRPFILGICGAQGSGKSTLAENLVRMCGDRRLRCATLSLDDLYLSSAQRIALAETVHPLFRTRGVPGTHDLALGHQIFDNAAQHASVSLPRFDKLADDPFDPALWPGVDGPLDILIFEGWCVGARCQSPEALRQPVNELEAIEDPEAIWRGHANEQLADPYQTLFARMDASVLLRAPGFDVVAGWRMEQEMALAKEQRAGIDARPPMTTQETRRFTMHFQRITQHILANGAGWFDIAMDLDAERRLIAVQDRLPTGETTETARATPS